MVKSLKGFGWNIVGPASQSVAQHYFTIGPMYCVIRLKAFRGTKRHPYGRQSKNGTITQFWLIVGPASKTIDRYWVGGPTCCVPGTSYRRVRWLISGGGRRNRPTHWKYTIFWTFSILAHEENQYSYVYKILGHFLSKALIQSKARPWSSWTPFVVYYTFILFGVKKTQIWVILWVILLTSAAARLSFKWVKIELNNRRESRVTE